MFFFFFFFTSQCRSSEFLWRKGVTNSPMKMLLEMTVNERSAVTLWQRLELQLRSVQEKIKA